MFSFGGILKKLPWEMVESTFEYLFGKKVGEPLINAVFGGTKYREDDKAKRQEEERQAGEVRDICVEIMFDVNDPLINLRRRLALNNNHERDVLRAARARGLRAGEIKAPKPTGTKGEIPDYEIPSHQKATSNYTEMKKLLKQADGFAADPDKAKWDEFIESLHDSTTIENVERKLNRLADALATPGTTDPTAVAILGTAEIINTNAHMLPAFLAELGIETDEDRAKRKGAEKETKKVNAERVKTIKRLQGQLERVTDQISEIEEGEPKLRAKAEKEMAKTIRNAKKLDEAREKANLFQIAEQFRRQSVEQLLDNLHAREASIRTQLQSL